jgi:hypothetical protein
MKRGDTRPVTHTRLNGGKFHVPPEATEEFYAAYGMDLHHRRPLFYTEMNTPVFAMHFDIDFPDLMEEAPTLEFCQVVHGAVAQYFKRPLTMIVCAILDDDGLQRKGPGLHLIFPKAMVDTPRACAIWAGVVARCEEHLRWGRETWATVIDVGVLREKGSLRMIGSDKCEVCPSCRNGSDKKFCPQCNQSGHMARGKIYWPWKILPETPETLQQLADMNSNKAHAVRVCSVRTNRDAVSEDFEVPPGAPLPSKVVARRGGEVQMLRTFNDRITSKAAEFRNLETKVLPEDLLELLSESIRCYDPHYSQLVIRDVKASSVHCVVRVHGFHDRYCLNKGSEHTSNQIYFSLTSKGLCQRCWSKKAVERCGGCACQDFRGPMRVVHSRVMQAVFERSDEPLLQITDGQTQAPKKPRKDSATGLVCYGSSYHVYPDPFMGGFHRGGSSPFEC